MTRRNWGPCCLYSSFPGRLLLDRGLGSLVLRKFEITKKKYISLPRKLNGAGPDRDRSRDRSKAQTKGKANKGQGRREGKGRKGGRKERKEGVKERASGAKRSGSVTRMDGWIDGQRREQQIERGGKGREQAKSEEGS
jgi:hypothetical protein